MDMKFIATCMVSGLEKKSGWFGDAMLGSGMSSYKPPAQPAPAPKASAPAGQPLQMGSSAPQSGDVKRPEFGGKTYGTPAGSGQGQAAAQGVNPYNE